MAARSARTSSSEEDAEEESRSTDEEERLLVKRCIETEEQSRGTRHRGHEEPSHRDGNAEQRGEQSRRLTRSPPQSMRRLLWPCDSTDGCAQRRGCGQLAKAQEWTCPQLHDIAVVFQVGKFDAVSLLIVETEILKEGERRRPS